MRLPPGVSTKDALQILYSYTPNQGAAVLAVVVYLLVSIGTAAVTVKTKAWYMGLVTLTALLELAGWGSRLTTLSAPSVSDWGWQQSLIIISPVLLVVVQCLTVHKLLLLPAASSSSSCSGADAATVKPTAARGSSAGSTSSRIGVGGRSTTGGRSSGDGSTCSAASGGSSPTHASARSASGAVNSGSSSSSSSSDTGNHPILAKIMLWTYSAAEVVCILLQTSGAAVYADRANALYGRMLLLAGLGLQLYFLSALLALVAAMQWVPYFGFRGDKAFRPVFACLYATSGLINLRTIFRMAEFAQGYGRDISRHEAYLYALDFVPMFLCFLLFGALHYGGWLGPDAPAQLYRQAQGTKHLELAAAFVNKQQHQQHSQPQPQQGGDDVLHIHCS